MKNIDLVDAKLFDAGSALRKMQAQEKRAVDPNREYVSNHAAFLAACGTVDDLFYERDDRKRDAAIKVWKKDWENKLSQEDRQVYDFMREDRNTELHEGQSVRETKTEQVAVGNLYQDDGCTITGTGGMIGDGPQRAPLVIYKPRYVYEIGGVERDVTKVCEVYLALLQKNGCGCKSKQFVRSVRHAAQSARMHGPTGTSERLSACMVRRSLPKSSRRSSVSTCRPSG
jgi:hypothetical protein